jgi:hypothetical protein
LPKLTPPFDETADINQRARSYLHVHCGHCHRSNGGGSTYIFLTHDLSLSAMKAIGVRPTQGTFGIPKPELIAAGDPYRSALYFAWPRAAQATCRTWARRFPILAG